MKIALAQIKSEILKYKQNLSNARNLASQARDCDIIVFPETFLSGFAPEIFSQIPAKQNEKAREFLREISAQKVAIAGLALDENGEIYNRALVYQNGREIYHYDKIFLFSNLGENEFVRAGDKFGLCEISHDEKPVKIGLAICYDLRFGEIFRYLAKNGAQIIFVIAQFPHSRIEHFRTLARARAIEAQCFLVALNSASGGHSCVISPEGEILCELGVGQESEICGINLAQISLVRAKMDILKDERKEILKEIL
ncbi:hypothetical protein OFO12_06240 [Campylobacter sp. JMF_04 NA10]|uniref:nitrilase-related carbon-nitrogen hydrolase n=1 Tax=Campylobacter sp. JMF_04 NA10 TaxID=2983824 RepID=UPI0022E9C0EB|nr:nitrilase-related carbon-nitrogen hydrolase [Campylobacter sp. JMF_04 NA10]MDA3076962.1 hypothetical protein [Campylobacter sp. JMF_04 NA10]